ncbi:cytoplasmic tRNA 2-thiolation protein 2 isoform X1 [Frankliniella occidentalis]|uniref:Cytoplasmic tRNA 2-thiolation protein 2 n=1 Tax=Frankliniella occidentalis TaxID=133901 RepID=A0A6J1SXQ6_FRAOC|nr:cytoplasmic tRNA 2-thiolation protein 2 isoform X1 [Frankliniella occidentalis]
MCSRNDEEDGSQSLMEGKTKLTWTEVCQKCSTEKPVIQILQIKHAYCRNCFLAHVNHKFRSTLGKSKMMKPSDVVLAAFSGSGKSNAMLHLLHAGLSEQSHKRFLFKVQVLYIDEGAILGTSLEDRTANLQAISGIIEQYGFKSYYTTLASIFEETGSKCFPLVKDSTLKIKENSEEELKNLFLNVKSLTAREDLLRQLRRKIFLQSAKELDCCKVFTANTSTDLAIHILTDVSLGRGSQMHHDVSFCDPRDASVKIIRPLLELSSKEVTYYSVFHELESIYIPSLCTKASSDSSIHNMSKQFVMELMENFPSTVSTVFRTGEKLGSTNTTNTCETEDNLCIICQMKLDVSVAACSSVQATDFSRLISSLGPAGFDNKTLSQLPDTSKGILSNQADSLLCSSSTSCCSDSDVQCGCHKDVQRLSFPDVEKLCCYGCRLIIHDMENTSSLPESILHKVRTRRSLENMRESIQDFLL